MKKEARLLMERAIDSLILSIEHFNRPRDEGRPEAVLILLDHSFELLLKAAILHKSGKIRKKRENQTIGFDECIRVSITLKIINTEQALTLQTINSQRDAAQHYILEISEQLLYLQTQMGLTLFRDILKDVFQKDIAQTLPKRVLPLSTTPPIDIITLFENEVDEIKKLLAPKKRRMVEATAKLRSLAIFDGSIKGEKLQPTQGYLSSLAKRIKKERDWQEIFSGVASINISPDGEGYALSLRITKKEGAPVHLVPEGTPGASVVAIKRVNELDFYNLSLTQLAGHISLTRPKTNAIIEHLMLRKNSDYFKEIAIGKSRFKRYSQKAIAKMQEELPNINIEEVWEEYQPRRRNA